MVSFIWIFKKKKISVDRLVDFFSQTFNRLKKKKARRKTERLTRWKKKSRCEQAFRLSNSFTTLLLRLIFYTFIPMLYLPPVLFLSLDLFFWELSIKHSTETAWFWHAPFSPPRCSWILWNSCVWDCSFFDGKENIHPPPRIINIMFIYLSALNRVVFLFYLQWLLFLTFFIYYRGWSNIINMSTGPIFLSSSLQVQVEVYWKPVGCGILCYNHILLLTLICL